jgi:dienelactone hydrolase
MSAVSSSCVSAATPRFAKSFVLVLSCARADTVKIEPKMKKRMGLNMIQATNVFLTVFWALMTFVAIPHAHANSSGPTGSISMTEDDQELERTWLKGALMLTKDLSDQLGIPAGEITRIDKVVDRLPALKFHEPMPLALMVHGCFGIGQEQIEQAKLLTARGFVVFMPSYYGRQKAFQLCGGNAAGEIQFHRVTMPILQLRLAEVDYGLKKARAFPFIRPDLTLVSGHSTGGWTLANIKRTDVTAYVITGYGCNPKVSRRPPKEVPLLAMRFKDDPWLNDNYQCDAGFLSGRDKENTISLVFDGQRTHEVIHDPRAVAAYLEFVGRVVGFPDPTASR